MRKSKHQTRVECARSMDSSRSIDASTASMPCAAFGGGSERLLRLTETTAVAPHHDRSGAVPLAARIDYPFGSPPHVLVRQSPHLLVSLWDASSICPASASKVRSTPGGLSARVCIA
jgi:hypothetical protein